MVLSPHSTNSGLPSMAGGSLKKMNKNAAGGWRAVIRRTQKTGSQETLNELLRKFLDLEFEYEMPDWFDSVESLYLQNTKGQT